MAKCPLSSAQKTVVRSDVGKAIGQICDVWPAAIEAEQSRGYPSGTSEGAGGIGSHGDPVPNCSLQPDRASEWLGRARPTLALLLKLSSDPQRVGFDPPRMRTTLKTASLLWIDLWPKNTMKLFGRLYDLANQGVAEWPLTPRKGSKVGEVIVGQKATYSEICAGCGDQVFGGAADPIVRIDGKPYHKSPCYQRAWRVNQKMVNA